MERNSSSACCRYCPAKLKGGDGDFALDPGTTGRPGGLPPDGLHALFMSKTVVLFTVSWHALGMQIAAIAPMNDLTLVTRTTADFARNGVILVNAFIGD